MGIFDPANYQFDFFNYYFWTALLNAVVAFVGGAIVLNRQPSGRKNIAFAMFCATIYTWSLSYAFWQLANTDTIALFWSRGLMFGAIFVPIALLHFIHEVLEVEDNRHSVITLLLFLIFEFFAFANLTPLFVSHVQPELYFKFWPQPGPLFHYFLVVWGATAIYAVILLLKGYLRTEGETRQQRKLMLFGFGFAVISSSTNFFLWYGIPIAPYANIFTSIYLVMVVFAMMNYRLFEISVSAAAPAIVDALADPMFIVNTEYRISGVNKVAEQVVGLPAESLRGKKISTFLPKSHEVIGKLLDGHSDYVSDLSYDGLELRTGSGRLLPILLSASRVPIKKKHGFVFICHDIADIKQKMKTISNQQRELSMKTTQLEKTNAELSTSQDSLLQALEQVQDEKQSGDQEHQRLQAVLGSIADGVFVVDQSGVTVLANSAAAQLIGVDPDDVVGRPNQEVFRFRHEDGSRLSEDFLLQAIEQNQNATAPLDTVLLIGNDKKIPVSVSAAPLCDEQDMCFGAVAVIRDQTRERALDKAKTEFISVASHQLRTPLSSMKWLIEMLEGTEMDNLSEQQKEFVSMIKSSSTRMTKLVNSLLNVYQIEHGQIRLNPKPTDMNGICRTVIAQVRDRAEIKELELKVELPSLGEVLVDSNATCNVLLNILSNAITFTPNGGSIEVSGQRDGDEVIVSVRDSGIGIPAYQHDKIFEKFYRGDNATLMDAEGAGLGLYVVKSVVDSSDGRVWLESQEGQGSTFHIAFPSVQDDGSES